jgi:hypothetical protein
MPSDQFEIYGVLDLIYSIIHTVIKVTIQSSGQPVTYKGSLPVTQNASPTTWYLCILEVQNTSVSQYLFSGTRIQIQ